MANPVQCVFGCGAQRACARDRQSAGETHSTLRSRLHGATPEQQQLLRVAPVERQFHDACGFHDLTDADAARLHQRRIGVDFNRFGNLADLEYQIDRRIAIDLQDNARPHNCAKPRQPRL